MLCGDMSHTRALISGQYSYWQVCILATVFPYVGLGLPMETILDSSWRLVSEGLPGRMDTHG